MATGTIYSTTSSHGIEAKIEWSAEHLYAPTGRTKITAKLYFKTNDPLSLIQSFSTCHSNISINGSTSSSSGIIYERDLVDGWFLAHESSSYVIDNKNYDDPARILITGGVTIDTGMITIPDVSGYAVFDLPNGEVAISSLSCSTAYFDGDITCKYDMLNTTSVKCKIEIIAGGNATVVREINLGNHQIREYTFQVSFSEEELAIIYNNLPSSASGKLRFTLTSGKAVIEGIEGTYMEITLSIPSNDSTMPTATMVLSPHSPSLKTPFNSMYIKGLSCVTATFNDAQGKYGATITSIKMTVLGKSYTSSPYASGYITSDGSVVVKGIITDSRGLSREYTQTINVLPYSNPRVTPTSGNNKIICERCDYYGNLSDSGTYLKIAVKRSFSKVVYNGAQKNFCQIRYRYKQDGDSDYSPWETILAENSSSDEVTTSPLLNGLLVTTKTYSVQLCALDTIGNSDNVTIYIPTDNVYIHKAASINSLGIGEYVEDENTLLIGSDITVKINGKVELDDWKSIGLGEKVSSPILNPLIYGRKGYGCYYLVRESGKHIYIAFNCMFAFEGAEIKINNSLIPDEYRPPRNVYSMCAVGERSIARVVVKNDGYVYVDWVQNLASSTETTSYTGIWIDGYIDYWV